MLELRHFQQDYKMLCGSSATDEKKLISTHEHIKKFYSHISEECYEWLFSLGGE